MTLPTRLAATGAIIALCGLGSGVATANPDSGIDSYLYKPALDSNGIFTIESAEALPKYDFSFKFGVGYGQDPLKVPIPGIGGATDDDSVLKFALGLHMTSSFSLSDKFSISLDAGLYRTDTDVGFGERGLYRDAGSDPSTGLISLRPLTNFDPSGGFEPQQLAGPLDARLGMKYTLVKADKLSVGLLGIVSAPFGDEEMFLGDGNMVFEPLVAVDYKLDQSGASRLMFNVGARIRERTALQAYDSDPVMGLTPDSAQAVIDVGSELVAGIGILYEVLPQLKVAAEATLLEPLPEGASYGSCRLSSGARCSTLKGDDYFDGVDYGDRVVTTMGGFHYRATADATLTVSAGLGLLGARKEDFRVMSGVVWQPTPAGTRTIGRGDTDGDGNPDSTDICPDEPEDNDGYQDDDGCPDLDNDGDGIIDASDACADEPEDKDGYQDDDGCPERDNDGDGVPDVTDRCPNDKEDKDGFDDEDGCPDEDNDGDGFPDAKDQCPDKKETVNGIDDLDGCPDEIKGGPQWNVDKIDLQGSKISFTGRTRATKTRLTAGSKDLLKQIAKMMKAKPRRIVRIEVHVALGTSSKNKRVLKRVRAGDKKLTNKRANVVKTFLRQQGVAAAQLRSDSLGSTRPQEEPATNRLNDRIDFIRVQ